MRLALISDIHGNAVALENVLNDIETYGVDEIAFLGDLATLGPAPNVVIEMVEALGCTCILGNHDEFLLDRNLICQYNPAPVIFDEVSWCRAQLSRDELAFINTFQRRAHIRLSDSADVLLFHGSPDCHMEVLLESDPCETLADKLQGHQASIMAGGHTHVQMMRQLGDTLLLNPGSVGNAFLAHANGGVPTLMSHAEYAVISAENDDISVDLRRVPLNKHDLFSAASAAKNPLRSWLMEEYS